MSSDSKISVYNVADCKNTTDDALQNYLNSLKFRQNHWYTDVKLFLGYTAVVISAVTFALDYRLGFEATKHWTLLAVVLYFALNGAFTYWIWNVEKGHVYTGVWKGRKIAIASRTEKYDPTYRISVSYNPTDLNTVPAVDVDLTAPFMQWFTADGYFVAKPFQQWLASSIPLIGDADPKNAAEAGAEDVAIEASDPEVVKDISENVNKSSKSAARKRG